MEVAVEIEDITKILFRFISMNFIFHDMIVGKVGQRGQIVIPKKFRDEKNIQPGDTVKFILKGEELVIEKIEPTDDLSVADILKRIKFEDNLVETLRNDWK